MHKYIKVVLLISIILVFSVSFAACGRKIPKKIAFDDTGYEVTFLDEFNGNQLDKTRWSIDTMIHPDKPHLNGIRRAGYYVEDAVNVKDGNLVISTNYRRDESG